MVENFLQKVIETKKEQIDKLKKRLPLSELEQKIKEIDKENLSLKKVLLSSRLSIIAEIKKTSPSAGILRTETNLNFLIEEYKEGGASALSIITEEKFFNGDIYFLTQAKESSLPILRKDFIIDPYQIYESKYFGADAILLITKILSEENLKALYDLTYQLGMEAVVEVHNEKEVEKVLKLNPEIIGINNRNLENLQIDSETIFRLKPLIPVDVVTIAESGIKNEEDLLRIKNAGFNAVLIGETLLKEKQPYLLLKRFINYLKI